MGELAERRVWLIRRAMKLRGVPQPLDAWRLLEWLGGFVTVRQTRRVLTAKCSRRADGGVVITLPMVADDRREAVMIVEEAGHPLNEVMPASIMDALVLQAARLDQATERREEQVNQRWQDCWWLPYESVIRVRTQADADDLIWEAGVDRETFERRWEQVRGLRLEFPRPEPWCAWGHYQIRRVWSPVAPRLRVISREPDGPTFEIPYATEEQFEERRWQLTADLAALQPTEFRLKYSVEELGAETDADLHWLEYLSGPGARLVQRRAGSGR